MENSDPTDRYFPRIGRYSGNNDPQARYFLKLRRNAEVLSVCLRLQIDEVKRDDTGNAYAQQREQGDLKSTARNVAGYSARLSIDHVIIRTRFIRIIGVPYG
jgi:hypothetical protein